MKPFYCICIIAIANNVLEWNTRISRRKNIMGKIKNTSKLDYRPKKFHRFAYKLHAIYWSTKISASKLVLNYS